MDGLGQITSDFGDPSELFQMVLRLLVAALSGAALGYERQRSGKSAGLRTHMLVAMGSATLVITTVSIGGSPEAIARVIQGIVTGIGFIGAGAIVKARHEEHIQGLTTAASVWMTAALGVAAGAGRPLFAALATLLAWIVLAVFIRFEAQADAIGSRIIDPRSDRDAG
jgi:putative Mg2+ transporter-C (MgtC) family protein